MTKIMYILFALMATAFIVGAAYYVIKPPAADKSLTPRLTPSPTAEIDYQEGFYEEDTSIPPAETETAPVTE